MSPRPPLRSAFVVLMSLCAIALLSGISAAQGLIDYSHIDVSTSGAVVTDLQGVRWIEGGSAGGGTGVFHPFLRLQADGIEKGFNTDYKPVPLDDKVGSWTHSLKFGTLATVTVSDTVYYSFQLDANETSGDPEELLCLDDLRIYSSGDSTLPDTTALFATAPLYAMLAPQDVKLTTALHSGTADMTVLIPASYFGELSPEANIYLYCSFGDCDGAGLGASSGFEEWDALTGSDTRPIVNAPLGINGEEGGTLTFDVTASDPDGDVISSLTANLAGLPEGDADFTSNGDNTQGTFLWHMLSGDAGTYSVTFTATALDLSATATTVINVGLAGTNITGVFTWTPQPGQEGVYHVIFTASDAGGSSTLTTEITVTPPIIILSPSTTAPAPLRGTGTPAAEAPQAPMKGPIISGTGSTTVQSGSTMTLTVSASTDPSGASAVGTHLSARLERAAAVAPTLTVDTSELPAGNDATFTVDNQPVVNPPAPITVAPGTPISLTVTAVDPDGDAIEDLTADLSAFPAGNPASFTAGSLHLSGTLTWTPRLEDQGVYHVIFTAWNRLVGLGATDITVTSPVEGRVFVLKPVLFNIGSARSEHCISIEPTDGSFVTSDIDVSTLRLISEGTGSVSEIALPAGKPVIFEDRDNNHVQELTACFLPGDLRLLFGNLSGKNVVTVTVRAQLLSGAFVEGTADVVVTANGPSVGHASVSPNPLNPQAKLSLMLSKAGPLRVTLYDAQGRMVRELARDANAGPGLREITVDGTDSRGAPLASGVYYYRVESADGGYNGRLAIVR